LSTDAIYGSIICLRGTQEYKENFSEFSPCLDRHVSCEILEFGTALSPTHPHLFGYE